MPITSAKFVNLYLRPSKLADIVAFIALGFYLSLIVLLDVPLIVQLYCFYLALSWWREGDLLQQSLVGLIHYSNQGLLRIDDQPDVRLKRVITYYSALFLHIQTEHQSYLLWRDSCSEALYRNFIFQEKRRQAVAASTG